MEEHMTRNTRIATLGGPAILIVMLALVLGCQPQPAGVMTVEEATAFINAGLPIWNEGKLDLVDELYAPDLVRHDTDIGPDVEGLDIFKGYVTAVRVGYPDFHVTSDEVLVAGDRIINRWTLTGTNLGEFRGDPPTGASIRISGVAISIVVDGKTTEEWNYWNDLAGYQQLGYTLVPPAMEEEPAE
jgi:steroid delta-isomerase-like uncharacterized protein